MKVREGWRRVKPCAEYGSFCGVSMGDEYAGCGALTTIAAVHGVILWGFELALVCDIIIADRMARFCFPSCGWG